MCALGAMLGHGGAERASRGPQQPPLGVTHRFTHRLQPVHACMHAAGSAGVPMPLAGGGGAAARTRMHFHIQPPTRPASLCARAALKWWLTPLRLLRVPTQEVAVTLLLSIRFMSLVFEEVRLGAGMGGV